MRPSLRTVLIDSLLHVGVHVSCHADNVTLIEDTCTYWAANIQTQMVPPYDRASHDRARRKRACYGMPKTHNI